MALVRKGAVADLDCLFSGLVADLFQDGRVDRFEEHFELGVVGVERVGHELGLNRDLRPYEIPGMRLGIRDRVDPASGRDTHAIIIRFSSRKT